MEKQFPDGFWWGAASSAEQSEGGANTSGKAPTVWDYWFEKNEELFFDRQKTVDEYGFYHKMQEDITLMKECGLNSFRTSLSWARLMPDSLNVNNEAVKFYQTMLSMLNEHGIEPIVNLYHFDLPLHLHKAGGWENREIVDLFVRYAEEAFQRFGHLAVYWTTFNEPIVPIEMGYLNTYHLPAVYSPERACLAGYNTMIAHAKAVKVFKNTVKNGKIGIILNLMPSYPRSQSVEDQRAAFYADLIFNRSYLDPAVKGAISPELINLLKNEELNVITEIDDSKLLSEGVVDFLGVNYYQPRRVMKADANSERLLDRYFKHYTWPDAKINPHRGWEIYEKGLYDIATRIREEYGNIPWYVAENGMGIEGEKPDVNDMLHDNERIQFYENHLKMLHKGIEEGSKCFGYHVWTFIDNWSWLNAYKNRYGLIHFDVTNGKRTKKESAKWFKVVSETNSITENKVT